MVTAADYAAIQKKCRRYWGTGLRGMLPDSDFDDFVQNVAVAVLEGKADDTTLGNACRTVLFYMRDAEEKQASVRAQAAFEAGLATSAHFEVPHFRGWGGARAGAGRPKKIKTLLDK